MQSEIFFFFYQDPGVGTAQRKNATTPDNGVSTVEKMKSNGSCTNVFIHSPAD